MGLLESFVANVFDIYPSKQFLQSFVSEGSLDLSRMLSHDFLKLSLVYTHVWNNLYKTYPTKRDFVQFVNLTKALPENDAPDFSDKSFVEKTLNTFMHAKIGLLKHIETASIYSSVVSFAKELDSAKFVEDQLIRKWRYRFCCSEGQNNANLLQAFAYMQRQYRAPAIYEYQINPVSGSYNESVLFGEEDDLYLTEHEKIQYTMYKDHHFMVKLINSVGICFDVEVPKHVLEPFVSALTPSDGFLNLINCKTKDYKHDPDLCHEVHEAAMDVFPSVFSTFVCVSDAENPERRSLGVVRDRSIHYLFAQKPRQSAENNDVLKTYDRCVISNLDHSTGKGRLNKYFVLSPPPASQSLETFDVLCGPKSFEKHSRGLQANNLTITTDASARCRFVLDLEHELDILDHMAAGAVPVVSSKSLCMYVVPNVTGYACLPQNDPVELIVGARDSIVDANIRKNLRRLAIAKHESVFSYYWKKHSELSCPARTMHPRNGVLLYLNFAYLYFMKNLTKIVGLEDKASRNSDYRVVLIDNRANPLSALSVLFALANLNLSWSCTIYTSSKARAYYQTLVGDVADVETLPDLDATRFHIDIYNRILKDAEFWRSINAQKTLIVQDDGVLLRPGIEKFMQYDYIGASWVDCVANEYIKKNITEDLVGNGGLSLRTNATMIRACENFEKEKRWLFYKNLTQIPEDVYFVYCLKKLGDAKLPKFETGAEFASEQVCHLASLGVHKLWAYHSPEIVQKYLNTLLE